MATFEDQKTKIAALVEMRNREGKPPLTTDEEATIIRESKEAALIYVKQAAISGSMKGAFTAWELYTRINTWVANNGKDSSNVIKLEFLQVVAEAQADADQSG